MPVNEAPWLTRRVELMFMVAMFCFCFMLDSTKCKTGRLATCLGGSASLCDRDVEQAWCDDLAMPLVTSNEEERRACASHNSSLLLVHVVDVGAPVALTKKYKTVGRVPITPLVAEAMRNISGGAVTANNEGGFLGAPLFAPLRSHIGLSLPKAGNSPPVGAIINVSYSHDTVVVPPASTLLMDLESVLPFRNDYFAIRRYLPGLQRVFERLLSRKTTLSAKKRDPCSMVHLVIATALRPGTDVAWVGENTTLIPMILSEAQKHVRRTISRYLRKKPRYTRLLKSVWFVDVPIGYPVHDLSLKECFNTMSAKQRGGNRAAGGFGSDGGSNASAAELAAAVCTTSGGAEAKACRAMCAAYQEEVSAYRAANEGLQKTVGVGGRRLGQRSFLLPYRDHFHTGEAMQCSHWRDCSSLSAEGSTAMARSIASSFFA
ncbi:hypothetical protein DQ04_02461120 [Trypanosoma grayi]|uniref:hypothetical protein n=1 Tax=Trypanosoma grayi TaxID=71804 RepID=UPI0004F47942|nr:hypothetical protein DQ04_02461120 [Trypanosoma grayi]KEG11597.1 hypothetical protein DQ04_02461120 [Trypanosoma grayi]